MLFDLSEFNGDRLENQGQPPITRSHPMIIDYTVQALEL
jgi:hypothetical protein